MWQLETAAGHRSFGMTTEPRMALVSYMCIVSSILLALLAFLPTCSFSYKSPSPLPPNLKGCHLNTLASQHVCHDLLVKKYSDCFSKRGKRVEVQVHLSLQVAQKNRCRTSKRSSKTVSPARSAFLSLAVMWLTHGTTAQSNP